jgi:replicative DNA helicase
MNDNTHLPPQDLEAEEALLGACLQSAKAIETALSNRISRASFLRPAHQHVWDAILALHERDTVDELTVHRWLHDAGHGATVGGLVGVSTLVDRCPAVANVRAYAVRVREVAARRAIVVAGHDIARLGYEPGDRDSEALPDAAREILDGSTAGVVREGAAVSTMVELMQRFYDDMTERYERDGMIAGLPTGIAALDERWGGLQPGRMYVVAGRPGMGKTALGMGMAEAVAFGSGVDVLAFNFEMSPTEQGGRLLARVGSLDLHRLANTKPSAAEFQAAAETMQRLMPVADRLHVDESPALTVGEVCRRARRHARVLRRDGRRLGLVVVDYLQKIRMPQRMEQEQAIALASGELKALALELEVPVIALAQLNRGSEHREGKVPQLSDLRGSGAIEQDADVVALLHRPEYYDGANTDPEWRGRGVVITGKSRVGASGVDDVAWEGQHVRYSDWRGPVFLAGVGVGVS